MADFDPDAYLAEPFNPDTYLAGADKESFLQKIRKSAGEAVNAVGVQLRPVADIKSQVESPIGQFITKSRLGAIGQPIERAGGAIKNFIPQPDVPTANPFSMAQSTLSGIGQLAGTAVKGIGSMVAGMGIGDLVAMGAGPLESGVKTLLARNPGLPTEQAVGAVLKIKSMPKEEVMSLSDLHTATGTAEKAKAATSFVPPQSWKSTTPIGNAPVPTPAGKPFTLQAGMDADNQSALEAFRARLPKGPENMPQAAPEAVAAPKPDIVPQSPITSVSAAGKGFAGNINLTKYPQPAADILKIGNKATGFAEQTPQTIPEMKAVGVTPEAQDLFKQVMQADKGSLPGAVANARDVLHNEALAVADQFKNIASIGENEIAKITSLVNKGQEVSKGANIAGNLLRVHQEATGSLKAQQVVDVLERIKQDASKINSPGANILVDGLTNLQKTISKKAFDLSQTSQAYRQTLAAGEKAYYVYINSILSNPITHLKNMAGNAIFASMKPVEKVAAATIDNVRSLFGGQAPEHTYREAYEQSKAALKFLVGKTEALPFDVGREVNKLDTQMLPAIGGKIGKVAGTPTHWLEKEDDFFKQLVGQMEYAGLKSKGVTGEALKAGTKLEAAYRTFQADSGPIVKALISVRDIFPGANLIIPFIKTPTQLFMRGAERSPLGFVKIRAKMLKWGGNYKQADFAADMGNALLGSTAAAYLAYQYSKDAITGSYPKDKNEREVWQAEGKQPYSINIKGRWIPLDKVEPIGGIVKTAIAGIDAYKASTSLMPEDKASEIATRLGQELSSQSALNGFNNLSSALSDPERSAGKIGTGIVTGFVPGASKFVTDLTDPYLRAKQGIVETAKSKIPGLSKTLPPQRDLLGNPLDKTVLWGQTAKDAPELEFAKSLEVNLPNTKKLSQPITPLTTFEENQYRALVGNDIKQLLQYEMKNPSFDNPEDERKHIEREMSDIVDEKKGVISTRAEFRNLGISFSPDDSQARDIYKEILRDKDYKAASLDQRRAMMNRYLLFKQQGK